MQVNDLDSSDSSMTRATSLGYLRYPPPAVFVANFHSSDRLSFAAELAPMSLPLFSSPSFSIEDSRIERQLSIQDAGSNSTHVDSSDSVNFQTDANAAEQYHNAVPPMETSPLVPPGSHPGLTDGSFRSTPISDVMEADEMQPVGRTHHRNFTNLDALTVSSDRGSERNQNRLELAELGQLHRILPGGDYAYWEQPFLQGWLMGQSQAGLPSMLSLNGGNREHSAQATGSILTSHLESHNLDAMVASLAMPGSTSLSGVSGRSAMQQRFANLHFSVPESAHGPTPVTLREGGDAQPIISRIQSELATSLAAAAAAELPCTVKLRVWSHDITNPSATLSAERCRLTIPHAVLCRYVEIYGIYHFIVKTFFTFCMCIVMEMKRGLYRASFS